MLIEVRDVQIPELFQVSHWDIRPGERWLIQGPSGLGKTTLLHLLGGILPPAAGRVTWDGQDVYALNENTLSHLRRRQVGLVYQKLNLIDHLSALENLRLLSTDTGDLTRARDLLKNLGLEKLAARRAGVLSLGEQQRIAVGRVLLQKPDLLLADEPTSSLDRPNAEKIMELLLDAADGKSFVVVSHDERIEKYFDRVTSFQELVR